MYLGDDCDVIGMKPTSGQTMFGFVARICATAVSLVLSLVVWYIVDGKTAGVIVFLYLANVLEVSFFTLSSQRWLTGQYYFYISTAVLWCIGHLDRNIQRHHRLRAPGMHAPSVVEL